MAQLVARSSGGREVASSSLVAPMNSKTETESRKGEPEADGQLEVCI